VLGNKAKFNGSVDQLRRRRVRQQGEIGIDQRIKYAGAGLGNKAKSRLNNGSNTKCRCQPRSTVNVRNRALGAGVEMSSKISLNRRVTTNRSKMRLKAALGAKRRSGAALAINQNVDPGRRYY
jgi:hypothetical protein